MSKSIPDRWLDYKPYGDLINGTRIMAFKVPLKETVAKNLQPEQQLTTAILMKTFPKLKYIIDLTNTTRYYDSTEFANAGIKYQKVMIPGMQVPPMEYVKRFFKALETFTAECADDEIIGVHCTHGINRSGYLICRYLVQQLGWKHSAALKAFADARGHPIERATYVADLKRAPCNAKIDVSKVNLDAPIKIRKRPTMGPKSAPYPPMGPPNQGRRGYMNGGPFPPMHPNKYFREPRAPGFGPPRVPPPLIGPPVLPPLGPPPMYGPPRPPRGGPYGPPMIPPLSMRPGPPPPPAPMRMPPGPPRPLPMGPPSRIPPGPPGRAIPPRGGPRPLAAGPPMRMAGNKMPGGKRSKRIQASKQIKDQDFTADVFEENLAKPVRPNRKKHQKH